MSDENKQNTNEEQAPAFSSKLEQGRQRFLAHCIEHALAVGRRTPLDFIRHFSPQTIMEGLGQRPSLRAEILVQTTGLKRKIAMKKPWESAAADLQIALEENETDAAAIVSVFDPDDRVRYLDNQKIWAFLIEGDFWKTPTGQKAAHSQAKSHIAFMLERALQDQLLTHRDIVEGISVAEMAVRLPKDALGVIISAALQSGHQAAPFTEVELLASMPTSTLVEYVPLKHIYEKVVIPKIAEAHEYIPGPEEPAEEKAEGAAEARPSNGNGDAKANGQAWANGDNQDWVDVGGDSQMPSTDEISDDDFAEDEFVTN